MPNEGQIQPRPQAREAEVSRDELLRTVGIGPEEYARFVAEFKEDLRVDELRRQAKAKGVLSGLFAKETPAELTAVIERMKATAERHHNFGFGSAKVLDAFLETLPSKLSPDSLATIRALKPRETKESYTVLFKVGEQIYLGESAPSSKGADGKEGNGVKIAATEDVKVVNKWSTYSETGSAEALFVQLEKAGAKDLIRASKAMLGDLNQLNLFSDLIYSEWLSVDAPTLGLASIASPKAYQAYECPGNVSNECCGVRALRNVTKELVGLRQKLVEAVLSGLSGHLKGSRAALILTLGALINVPFVAYNYTTLESEHAPSKEATESTNELSPEQKTISILKANFEAKEYLLKTGIEWAEVEAKLEKNPEKLAVLQKLIDRGGEPTVTAKVNGKFRFDELSKKTPMGSGLDSYQALALVQELGAEMMETAVYEHFLGKIDLDYGQGWSWTGSLKGWVVRGGDKRWEDASNVRENFGVRCSLYV